MAILDAEWQEFINRIWNFERPIVFVNVILIKMFGICRSREIRERVSSRIYLWGRGLHAGLVGDAEVEEAAR